MIDVLIGLLLVALGFAAGRRRLPAPNRQFQPEAQEQAQLLEDRMAFSQLMGYNADRAYGLLEEE